MSISTIYHVSVDVLDGIADYIDANCELQFEIDMMAATQGNVGAGSNNYAHLEHWADFTTLAEAVAAEAKMRAVIAIYTTLAKDNHEQR